MKLGLCKPHHLSNRLKQIDFDGSYEYSDEVLVDNLAPIDYALQQNYPNPFNLINHNTILNKRKIISRVSIV